MRPTPLVTTIILRTPRCLMTHDRDDPFAVIEAEAVRQTAAE